MQTYCKKEYSGIDLLRKCNELCEQPHLVLWQSKQKTAGHHNLQFSSTFFRFTFTRIISSPTCTMSQKGITYSFSLHRNPQKQPGPNTMIAVIQPLHISKSTSPTNPRRLQSSALITSFCFNSDILKPHRTCLFSLVYPMRLSIVLMLQKSYCRGCFISSTTCSLPVSL